MLKWSIIFALIALVAGVLGFTGVAAGAAGIAKILDGVTEVFNVPFTLLKGLVDVLITFLIYKKLSPILHK